MTKDKIVSWMIGTLLVIFICISVFLTFRRFFISKDYLVRIEADCNPEVEKCFIYHCDPEEEECSGDPDEDTWYYKILEKKAYLVPSCEGEEDCREKFCEGENDPNCKSIYCSEDEGNFFLEIECTKKEDFVGYSEEENADETSTENCSDEDGCVNNPDKEADFSKTLNQEDQSVDLEVESNQIDGDFDLKEAGFDE